MITRDIWNDCIIHKNNSQKIYLIRVLLTIKLLVDLTLDSPESATVVKWSTKTHAVLTEVAC